MNFRSGLLTKLLLGIVGGIVLGSLGSWLGFHDAPAYEGMIRLFSTFTSLFSTFLSFIIPLLIVAFVAVGMADLSKQANKLFGITIFLAYASTILAGYISYFFGIAVLPNFIQSFSGSIADVNPYDPFLVIKVAPVFDVMTGLMLAFILGIGMANLKIGRSGKLLEVLREMRDIITKTLTKIIIPLIPIYVGCLFCKLAAQGKIVATAKIFISLYVCILLLQVLYIALQFAISGAVCRKNNFRYIPRILPAYFTAVGTQSSASTIPVNLKCARNSNISEDVTNFCIPLCATIHLAGDTICLVLGTMGIMMAMGMDVSLSLFTPYIFMLGITMVAAPGVPGGGVMAALGIITSMLGFTEPMQQLIISLHFSQDSFGTATNVTGDQALAMIIDKVSGNADTAPAGAEGAELE